MSIDIMEKAKKSHQSSDEHRAGSMAAEPDTILSENYQDLDLAESDTTTHGLGEDITQDLSGMGASFSDEVPERPFHPEARVSGG
ncbi:hypothetical protein ZTR_10749 [Talaromyces verruculosus]|nr:hypothetical protein ZTR_10749 [Talaromyces verruculosus]